MNKKVVFLPYDFDTAIGINNEGSLTFGYNLEDTDHLGSGANVFNGQESVFWTNLRDTFGDELKAMYQTLRSRGVLSYDVVEQMFEEHQDKWPEAIFNEDAWFKYIDPLLDDNNASYLSMALGSKAEQRKWWLYNRFRYIDSKYVAGDALTDVVTLRGYAKANVSVTPYADIYPTVKYGSYVVQERGQRGVSTTLVNPLSEVNDTEIYIYSASQLQAIGDLSGLKVGYADLTNATRVQTLKLGDSSSSYENGNLTELYLGANELLTTLDVRRCPNLTQTVNLSQCPSLENVYFDNSGITGVELPNGSGVKVLHLPNTVTYLKLRNLQSLTDFTMAGYSNITTLWLEGNNSRVNATTIYNALPSRARVRLLGVSFSVSGDAQTWIDRLDSMRGLDEQGNTVSTAQVSGTVNFETLSPTQLAYLQTNYPNLTVTYTTLACSVRMYNEDGSTLYQTNTVTAGQNCPSYTPTKTQTAQYTYSFSGWSTTPGGAVDSNALTNIQTDKDLYAVFTSTVRTYRVRFYNGTSLLQTVNNVPYGGSATFTGSTPEKEDYDFVGWSPSPSNITGATDCIAQFSPIVIEIAEISDSWAEIIAAANNGTYRSKYKCGNYKPLDLGSEGIVNMQIVGFDKDPLASGEGNSHITWLSKELLASSHQMNPTLANNYTYDPTPSFLEDVSTPNSWTSQNRYAKQSEAEATWQVSATEAGTITIGYKTNVSGSQKLSLQVNNSSVVSEYSNSNIRYYNVEVSAGDVVTVHAVYTLLESYDYYATIKFSGTNTFTVSISNNVQTIKRGTYLGNETGTGAIGGWRDSEMRVYLDTTIKPLIPSNVREAIVTVNKYTFNYEYSATASSNYYRVATPNVVTADDVWIPARAEVNIPSLDTTGAAQNNYETRAPRYPVFSSYENRTKYLSGTAEAWWLRSGGAYGSTTTYPKTFATVTNAGHITNVNSESSHYVALGFCI